MSVNYYSLLPNELIPRYHNPSFKNIHIKIPFRALIIGPSGSMKTNLLVDLLHKMKNTFHRIIICCKSKEEPLYRFLSEKAPQIEFFENGEIPPLEDWKEPDTQGLIVFDDLVLNKDQKIIEEYFIRARKLSKGVSCAYLTQSYFKTPKTIRLQCNYIFIKKLSNKRDLKLILSEFSLDIDYSELETLYRQSMQNKTDFMLLDMDTEDSALKYRRNYGPPNYKSFSI